MDQALESTANHALEACERMLRPIMRLALDRGLKYQDIDELIRTLMLDEAAREWAKRNGKEPSGSQLSVTTGINRKEVKKRLEIGQTNAALPSAIRSLPAQVFRLWIYVAQTTPALKTLAIDSIEPSVQSFASLVKQCGGDVHHRSVLDELVRLKLVSENGANVILEATAFVPPGPGPEMLAWCAVNSASHMTAAVENICGRPDPFLERAIWVDAISLDDCKAIEHLARELWAENREKLYQVMAKAATQENTKSQYKIRVGTYAHFEPMIAGENNAK